MKNSSLEITEQEYLIKLSREEFNLGFIHQLLRRIQTEQFFSAIQQHEADDLKSRLMASERDTRFDDLRDK